MVVAHVELSEAILHDTGQLQDDLVQLLVLPTRLGENSGVVDCVGGRAKARLDRLASGVQALRRDDHLRDGVRAVRG